MRRSRADSDASHSKAEPPCCIAGSAQLLFHGGAGGRMNYLQLSGRISFRLLAKRTGSNPAGIPPREKIFFEPERGAVAQNCRSYRNRDRARETR